MIILKCILALVAICVVLNFVCDKLGDNLEEITEDIKMDRAVAGATFLAISSSIPEFLTSFMSIVVHKRFEEVGFATIAGSGIFNVLLIPMLSILAYKGTKINFDKTVGKRDLMYYGISIGVLAVSMFFGAFSWITGAVLVSVYVCYIMSLFKGQTTKILWKNAKKENILMSTVCLIPIAVLIHYAIEFTLQLSSVLGVSGFVVSVIILAGVTSVPDLMLSIQEAKKGEIDSATSNAIGSNIFDINICLGACLLITGANVKTNFSDNAGILMFLVASALSTGFVLFNNPTKKKTGVMAITYIAFIAYVILSA